MKSEPSRSEPMGSTHRTLGDVDAFAEMRRREVDVGIFPRKLAPELRLALRALAARTPISLCYEGAARDFDACVFLEALGASKAVDFLVKDLALLVPAYARALDVEHVKVSLATVEDDACRKFHADYVVMRLLCTYAGPGTEVLDEPGLCREAMSTHDVASAANPRIRGTATLHRADEGEVLLLKGRHYPGNAARGAVHRSPPIAAEGRRRLVLKIDVGERACARARQ